MARLSRLYLLMLGLQVLVIFLVTGIFRVIESRFQAGMTAGVVFVALGVLIVWQGVRSPIVRRTPTFYLGSVHLFLMSLPMLITRLTYMGEDFSAVRVMGLSGPMFHRVSTAVYLLMMTATVTDLIRFWRRERLEGEPSRTREE